jgi:hypothetical protein
VTRRVAEVAERGEAAVAAAVARARADLALVRQIIERIGGDFYAMGVVLKRLKDSGAAAALGYRSFGDMCKAELDLSLTTANKLVRVAEEMGEKLARGLGKTQAFALIKLCDATPEDDTAEGLATGTVRLPSGEVLDVGGSTSREKDEAAKEIRDAAREAARKSGDEGGSKAPRGRTTSAEERRVAAEAEAALHAVGLKDARVRAVATRPGKPGALRIEGIPTTQVALLCKALCRRRGK